MDRMDKIFEEETRKIIGCSFEVMNTLGCGFREKAYERALVRELELQQIPFDQQRQFPLNYKDTLVDTLIPDLVVFDQIIVDLKVIPKIGSIELAQMLSYLAATKLPLGLIINFQKPTVEFKRIYPLVKDNKPPNLLG